MKNLLVLLFLSLGSASIAQQTTFCLSDKWVSAEKLEHKSKPHQITDQARSSTTLNIRTVFHVIYHTDEENIPEEEILTMLDGVNDLFQAKNIDQELINPIHQSKLTKTNIQFCLATEDPFGNPTNGITRTETEIEQFQFEFPGSGPLIQPYKNDSTGGSSPWDVTSYFNIWIVQLNGLELYANYGYPLPGHVPSDNYYGGIAIPGVTFDMDNFFDVETAFTEPVNVLAHEFGHFLGLLHTFGVSDDDFEDLCEVDDEMEDTPLCDISPDCNYSADSCIETEGDEEDNVANFMNYGCMLMFTPDQTLTMRSNILTASPGLLADENCSGMTVTSVSEFAMGKEAFDVFPNPSQGSFYLQFNDELIGQDIEWAIYDIHSQEIQSHKSNDIQRNAQRIDISIASAGIYFITVKSKNTTITKKLIIK